MDPLTLGLILSLSSAVVLVTLFLLIKQRLARRQPQQLDFHAADSIVLSEHNDSIARLVVKGGGRLVSMNAEAQRWFNLYEKDSLSLERIAAKIRPREAFFALCAEEGETRLALDGRLIQANSSQLYLGDQAITLLTLQAYRAQNEVPSTTGLPEHAWEIFRNLSEHVGQQNDSKDVVLKLLESIEFLLPADKIELSVLDETDSSLVPYQLSGLPGDLERVIEHERQSLKSPGLAGYVYQRRVAVLAENFEAILELQKNGNSLGDVDEYRSLIGVPLKTGKSVFGTLHFLSRVDDTFQAEDLDIVNLVATQMSFILYDFKLRQKEEQRAVELNKLLALTRGFTELFETRNVFASLLKMLTALIPVEVLGFLIYDEKKQVLEGKNPFQGLPPQFIDLYFSRIPPNSEAEKTLLLQKVIITENAAESQQWETLGLIHLSQAASLQETALIPLVSGGRMLGYLQASNHSAGVRPFSENELNLLTLAAAQAAPIIENNALVQENVKHTKHTASLRRIANLASSASEVEDIIRLTLRELSVSFNADISLMFLLDESSASLEMHPSSVYGKLNSPPDYERLLMGDAQFPFSVSGSLNTRLSINCSRDNSLIPYYQDLLSRWEIESVVIAPLIVRDEGIGEIWIGSQKLSQYNQSDAQFLSSAAIQMASLIENTRLMLETDEDIRRRLEHFSMLKRIGFELNTSTDLNYLLQIISKKSSRSLAPIAV